jgi:hypothetical protein
MTGRFPATNAQGANPPPPADAARLIIARRGYDETNVLDITRKRGFSKGQRQSTSTSATRKP